MSTLVDPIAAKLERLEAKPSLVLDAVDYAVRDCDSVRARLAAPLAFSQRVEAMVTGLSIETLLPRAAGEDGYINRFLTVWEPDEQGHALALERLLVVLDIEPFPLPQDEPVPFHNRLAGLLGTISRRMHETVELIYHAIGAMNERLAFTAYERMSDVLVELGEHGLVDTLMQPLRRDESAHLGYYRTAARDLRDRLDGWQLAMARAVITHTYSPGGRRRPAGQAGLRRHPAGPRRARRAGRSCRPGPAPGRGAPLGGRAPAAAVRGQVVRPLPGGLGHERAAADRPWPARFARSMRSRTARPKIAKAVP